MDSINESLQISGCKILRSSIITEMRYSPKKQYKNKSTLNTACKGSGQWFQGKKSPNTSENPKKCSKGGVMGLNQRKFTETFVL